MIPISSEAGKKALQLLKQPTPEVDAHTPYARPGTPYFTDVTERFYGEVDVVVHCDFWNGTAHGESNYRDRLQLFSIPANIFRTTLGEIQPAVEVSTEIEGEFVEIDRSWGFDCSNPYYKEIKEKVRMVLLMGISGDMKTATLVLFRHGLNGFELCAQLRQGENV